MPERKRADFLRQLDGMTAHDRTESTTAAAELRNACRTVTSTAGALLLVHFLAGAVDLRTALGFMRAALTLGELPIHATLNEILARLQAENRVGQFDRTRFLTFERDDLEFHHSLPCSADA